MNPIVEKLIAWYERNKRRLPWRRTNDPYKIWVSEVILQQTRVNQGINYYYRFLEAFPDVEALAHAEENDVLRIWQGLGYYSRARNMHLAAKTIVNNFGGKFPSDYKNISALKGIGDYTAGAIASFAFGMPYTAVDGNVKRVLSRLFGIYDQIDTSVGEKKIKEVAKELLPRRNPGTFNQALIEFGAMWCTPRNPKCGTCPLQQHCLAFAESSIEKLPAKKPRKKPRDRYLNYLVIHHSDHHHFYLRKRSDAADIWKNLYDFPLIESERPLSPEELVNTQDWQKLIGENYYSLNSRTKKKTHQLSHQTLHAYFWEVNIKEVLKPDQAAGIVKDKKSNIHQYPFPRLIDAFLQENFTEYGKNNK
ncbi:MAG: A/G-specific adenine glycosylase [Bacteroidales bacterium]|nr:A/G-specific adenine glycosylase [Bacteroidales bacterium]MCF8333265.1 A/G-specific adenine glycosylase [Bacteroidales bacterium]